VTDDFAVRGADELGRIAKHLKTEGNTELKRELMRALQRAGKPLKAKAKEAAREGLPHTGGLNELVANSAKVSVRTRTSASNPGIRLVASLKGHDLRAMDRGKLRRPVFGHMDRWVTQDITPGWWSNGMSSHEVIAPVRREVMEALEDVARRIARG